MSVRSMELSSKLAGYINEVKMQLKQVKLAVELVHPYSRLTCNPWQHSPGRDPGWRLCAS